MVWHNIPQMRETVHTRRMVYVIRGVAAEDGAF
jgi:hypothetical protein